MRWAVRLSSFGAQSGWLLTSMALLLAIRVVPKVRMHPAHYDVHTQGTVVAKTLDVVTYEFLDLDGESHRQSGVIPHPVPEVDQAGVGDPIDVWHDATYPEESALYRKEPNDIGPGSLAVLVLPLAGLVMSLLYMWQRRRMRLLRYGCLVNAQARHSDASGGRTANLSFQFDIEGTRSTTHLTTVRSPDQLGTTEPVLYDPSDPDHAIAIADLPGRPTLTDHAFAMTRMPFAVFVLPLTTLALIGVLVAKSV